MHRRYEPSSVQRAAIWDEKRQASSVNLPRRERRARLILAETSLSLPPSSGFLSPSLSLFLSLPLAIGDVALSQPRDVSRGAVAA